MRPKSILIVDDNSRFLTTSIEFFTNELGINVVSWAISPQEAVNKFYKFSPELVILDIGMNTLKGQELTVWFKNQVNSPQIMITSIYDNKDYRNFAKGLGADGFIKKVNYRAAYPELIKHLNQSTKKILRENNFLLN
ncbi:MAG: response regulator [Ignavibacteriaceae bacterium]|nr:response regulator [Ignavibacteriaceae bacterium]